MKKSKFVYWLCASGGWLLIVLGVLAALFGIIASGDNRLPTILGGLVVATVGILIVRIVEKNIFKALDTFLDIINW